MIPGFYWFIEDELAGCSRPGVARQGPGRDTRSPDERREALDRDLAWLRGQGIGALLSLTETPLDAEALARHALTTLHLPVPDLTPPTPAQLMQALGFIDRQRLRGHAVAVHCLAGQGRTGTVLAAYRIRAGAHPDEALRALRAVCRGAVENPDQERALHAFAARRDWIL